MGRFIFDLCVCRRNLNYFSSAYTAAVSAVDPDAGHGELVIKVPSELWKQGDGRALARQTQIHLMVYLFIYNAKHCCYYGNSIFTIACLNL